MIGIYKITSPSGKIYIGQSRNIELRQKQYKNITCSTQRKLYNSIIKYGWDKHRFEVLCECPAEQLNDLEIKFSGLYNSIGENGLNLRYCGGNKTKMSSETKQKMSASHRREKNIMFGKTHSIETRRKISEAHKGRKLSVKRIEQIRRANTGRIKSYEEIEKLRQTKIGIKRPDWVRKKLSSIRKDKKPIVAIKDCAIIQIASLCEASKILNRNRKTINQALVKGFSCNGYKLYYE